MTIALVGRAAERRRLKDALNDPAIRVVVMQGPSGAGKTALIDEVLESERQSGAIVGCGKYAEGTASGAFVPVMQALSQAANNALELLYDPVAGTVALREALKPQLALLAGAGLSVAGITPPKAASSTIPVGQAGAARLIEATLHLLRWLKGFGAPIVLFIDDWQRAPREVQSLATAISREDDSCTMLLAERDSDGERWLLPSEPPFAHILLGALDRREREALLEIAAGRSGAGPAISEWLSDSSSGLPFDLIQAAGALNDHGALVQSGERWTVDHVRAAMIDRADFSDAIVQRIRQMPESTRLTGAAIALWGDTAPLGLVADARGEAFDRIAADAMILKQAGVIDLTDAVARVLHDRLRTALLAAVVSSARTGLASAMSDRMVGWPEDKWTAVARTGLYLRLAGGLDGATPGTWRERFAHGALAARTTADMAAATDFAEAAFKLRERERSPGSAADRLILREGVFAAAARRDGAALKQRAELLIASDRTDAGRGEAYQAAILAARLVGDTELAWRWALEGFRSFGIRLPAKTSFRDLIWPTLRWRLAVRLRGTVDAGRIDKVIDPLIGLSNVASVIAFERAPLQAMLIALKVATHARRHRYSDPIWLSTDAFISATLNDHARAAEFGSLAAKHAEQSAFSPSTTLYRALYFGEIWTKPLASLYAAGEQIYQWSIAEGDIINAAVTVRNDALLAWRTLPTLDALMERLVEDERRADRLADQPAIHAIGEFIHFVRLLRDPEGLKGPVDYRSADGAIVAGGTPVAKVEMLALWSDWAAIVEYCEQMKGMRPLLNSHPGGVLWRFYETMARLRLGLRPRPGDIKFVRNAAALNPVDHRAKVLLLDGEIARAKGNRIRCLEALALAVQFAARGSSRLEEGFTAETAAFGARAMGDPDSATLYAAKARDVWLRWGANAKAGSSLPVSENSDAAMRVAEAQSQAATAARSERAKSRFLAEVAHELRTPLQGMQGLVELAAENKGEVDLKELRDVLGSLRNVVDDLTDLEALGSGAPLSLQPTDVATLLETEAAAFAALARKKGLSFSTTVEGLAGGAFLVDASRLRQIIRNLLSNAVKYVEEGSVVLRASAARGPERTGLTIAVEDTGPGIREVDLPRLFEPFERGGRDGANGLGLGLALSRRIAERMGGQLVAENRKPHGARFVLTFAAAPTAPAEPVARTDVRLLRLLLVEDVPLSRRMVAAMLRRDGHEVFEAASGREALDVCEREDIDLVFLDLGLPDIDGFEVLTHLRDRGLDMPVVVLTASAVPAMKERAAQAGAVMTLRKPASGDELRAVLAKTVGHAPSRQRQADELDRLRIEAREEIAAMAREIVDHAPAMDRAAIRIKAHRLAGLAAQFDAIGIAESADRLEAAASDGEDLLPALTAVTIALGKYQARHDA